MTNHTNPDIIRVYPEGASESDFVYSDGQQPPFFAHLQAQRVSEGQVSWAINGPYDEQQLALMLTERPLTPTERDITREQYTAHYVAGDVTIFNDLGRPNLEGQALALARLVFSNFAS